MPDSSKLLIDEPPLQVLPTLAKLLGIEQAIILQQVHYWVKGSNHEIGGYRWIYNRYKDWADQFPWLSERAIRHHVRLLEKSGLLITGDFNRDRRDHTKWYRIGYDALEQLLAVEHGVTNPSGRLTNPSGHATNFDTPIDESCHMEATKIATSVPETTPEITPKELSKKRYGEFDNVRLTDEEHGKLVDRFGDTDTTRKIENLSGYKKSKGKSYRDDYATILNWSRKDQDSDGLTGTSMDASKHSQGLYGHTLNHSLERCIEKGVDGPTLRRAIRNGDIPEDILERSLEDRLAFIAEKVS